MPKNRQVSTSRVIAADRQAIFDVIADPAMHPVIDGAGWAEVTGVQDGTPERLSEGARFGMEMKLGAPYPILNTVVEFEEGVRIAWRHFHGHRWRYELEDVEGGTQVTETFDWSTAKAKLPLELAGIPKRNLRGMERTLENLDRHLTSGERTV
ncbi:MAG: SRPBCC family protein [Nitriliruptor sp.]